VLQAKFGFTVENIVATARIQLGLEHDTMWVAARVST
jgi:hypothetical protein